MTIQTTIPHRFLGGEGHGNPSIAPKLQHTWGNHHEQRGEAMEMGENGKRRGNPTGFWRGMMTTDGGVPQSPFSSLLFLSLSVLDLVTTTRSGGTGRGVA